MKTILTEKQVNKINNAISLVWETGYSDKTVLLVEAMSAIAVIDAVLELAEKEKPARAD